MDFASIPLGMALVGVAIVSVLSTLATVAFLGWHRASKALQKNKRVLQSPQAGLDPQRIEQMVASLAEQVDQIASGQEFLQRVLLERLPPSTTSGTVRPPPTLP